MKRVETINVRRAFDKIIPNYSLIHDFTKKWSVKLKLENYRLMVIAFVLGNLLMVSTGYGLTVTSGTSNIGGNWTLSGTTYTFAPTGTSDATVSITSITSYLNNYNVIINNPSGDIIINDAIAAATTSTTQRIFTITATGSITINQAIDLTPAGKNQNGYPGSSIILDAGTWVSIKGGITATGGKGGNGSSDIGGNGGNITIKGNGGISILSSITTLGGAARSNGASGAITINDGATSVTIGGANDGQTAGVISGGDLIKQGAGVFLMGGTNTYTGTTTISAGTLSVSTAGNLGNASTAIVLGGATTKGTLIYSGNAATFTRGFTVNAGGGEITNASANLLTVSTGGITNGGTLTLSNTGSGGTTISGVISSTGSLTINNTGSGITTLSAANTYTGSTTISQGTLSVSGNLATSTNSNLGNSSTTIALNGGTLMYSGTTAATFGRAFSVNAGGGGITNASSNLLTIDGAITNGGPLTLSNTSSGGTTVNGVISSSGSLTINNTGAGITTLSGANTYTGTTTISKGTLDLGSSTTLSGDLSISLGAILNTANKPLTLRGNFTNSGTFTAGSSAITLSGGTNQSIAGITTTGSVTVDKTSGVVTLTGDLSPGNLTLATTNAGTLNLGAGKIHSISGILTMNGGALDGGSSTLKLGGSVSGTATFTASTGTVEYNAAAVQTIAPFTYHNLTLSTTSGTFTKTLGNSTTVNGILSVGSGVTLNGGAYTLTLGGSVSGAGNFNASTGTVEYNGSAAQTIAPFTYNNLSLSGGNTKSLNAATTITGDLSIGSSTTFETSNKDLTLSGNLTHGGSFNAGSSAITLSGGNNQIIAGFTTTGNVTVDKTAGKTVTLSGISSFTNLTITSGQLVIPAGSEVTVSGATDITPANGLIIESSPEPAAGGAGTGSFITGTTSGAGTASVVRYMSPKRWHLVSSPLAEQAIGTFLQSNLCIPVNSNELNPVAGNKERGMRAFDPDNNQWDFFLKEGSTEKLTTGKGFSMRVKTSLTSSGTQRVTFTGKLQPGSHDVPVAATKWNCVGNPYTSAITIKNSTTPDALDNFLKVNENNLDPLFGAIYIWNQPNGDVTNNVEAPGSYQTISKVNFSSGLTENSSNLIQQGQAFMVRIKSGASTVRFTEAMKVNQPSLALKSTEDIWPAIQLIATGDSSNSTTLIAFHEGMTKGLDPAYDAGLLTPGGIMELYTQLVDDDGIPFDIQALPSDQYDQLIIPVGVDYPKGGHVSFSARGMYLPAACRPILEDRLTGIKTDLTDQTYTADLSANTAGTGRFYLHTSWSSTGVDSRENNRQLTAWAQGNNEINIKGQINNGAMASLFDLQGRLIATHVMREGVRERFSLPAVKTGVYLLQVRDNQQLQTMKITIGQ